MLYNIIMSNYTSISKKRNSRKKEYYEKNKEMLNEKKRKKYRENLEENRKKNREYYEKNKDKMLLAQKKYKDKNRNEINEKARDKYWKNKLNKQEFNILEEDDEEPRMPTKDEYYLNIIQKQCETQELIDNPEIDINFLYIKNDDDNY